MTNLFSRTRDATQTKLNLNPIHAVIGDENGVVNDNVVWDSGRVFVRLWTSNGYSKAILVRGPYQSSVPLLPGHACVLKYDTDGLLFVSNTDFSTVQAGGGLPIPVPPPADGAYVTQDKLVTLRVSQTIPASKSVMISGWKPIVDSVMSDFEGNPDFDLTSLFPASGTHCCIGVFMQGDFVTPVGYKSTDTALNNSLTIADINECIAQAKLNETAVWFYDVKGDATQIFDANTLLDGRQIVNGPDGTVSATVSTTDATVTTLFTFTIPASTTFAIHANVVARRTGGASGTAEDGAYYERVAAIKNVAGTATLIGSVSTLVTIEDVGAYDCSIDVTGATARVRVTGVATTNIDWSLSAKVYKVS